MCISLICLERWQGRVIAFDSLIDLRETSGPAFSLKEKIRIRWRPKCLELTEEISESKNKRLAM